MVILLFDCTFCSLWYVEVLHYTKLCLKNDFINITLKLKKTVNVKDDR